MSMYRFSLPGLFFVSRSRDILVNMGKRGKREKNPRESFIQTIHLADERYSKEYQRPFRFSLNDGRYLWRANWAREEKFSLELYSGPETSRSPTGYLIFTRAINIAYRLLRTFDIRGTLTDLPVKAFAIASVYVRASAMEHLLNRYPGPLLSGPLSQAWIYRFQVSGIFHRAPTHRANIPSNTFARASLRQVSSDGR